MKSITTTTTTLKLIACLILASSQCHAGEPNIAAAGDIDLGHGYVRRNDTIHFLGGGITGTGADATRIDTPSPELLKKFVDSQFGPFTTAEGLDDGSFKALSEQYTRDKDRVYFKTISPGVFLVTVLPNADPATFEVLSTSVAKDKNHVWLHEQIQLGVDPATVVLVDGGSVFKDNDSVHYQYTQIAGADPNSFRHIGSAYFADKHRVYWGPDPVADADPATFAVLGDSFVGKDANHVYRSGQLLTGLDPATTELIVHDDWGFQIFSDKNGIHVNTMTFPRSKPGHVEVINNRMLKTGGLVLLVEASRALPVTVFKENGKLMAESVAWTPVSFEVWGTITAEVTAEGLRNIRITPLPGVDEVLEIPGWQMEIIDNPDIIKSYLDAGKQLSP